MNDGEKNAILAIAIHAAFADGAPADPSGSRSGASPTAWRAAPSPDCPPPTSRCWSRSVRRGAAAALTTPEARRFAYEMAVAVAEADGVRSEAERAFLDRLRGLLARRGGAGRGDGGSRPGCS